MRCRRTRGAGEQVPTELVRDRERIAVCAGAQAGLALEVCGPELIGGTGRGRGTTGMAGPAAPVTAAGESVPAQDIVDGAGAGDQWVALAFEEADDLQAAPRRMLAPDREDLLDQLR